MRADLYVDTNTPILVIDIFIFHYKGYDTEAVSSIMFYVHSCYNFQKYSKGHFYMVIIALPKQHVCTVLC